MWYLPKNLKDSENDVKKQGINEIDLRNDFASYRMLLESNDFKKSNIISHNDIFPNSKIKILKRIVRKTLNRDINSVLNIGCGVGFETKAISNIFKVNTLGVDISEYSIDYAIRNNKHPLNNFLVSAVDDHFLLDTKYDICIAIEFYPFTRTNDYQFQLSILKAIFNNLNSSGAVVMHHYYDNNDSIKGNVESLAKELKKKYYISGYMNKRVNSLIGYNKFGELLISLIKVIRPRIRFSKTIILYS